MRQEISGCTDFGGSLFSFSGNEKEASRRLASLFLQLVRQNYAFFGNSKRVRIVGYWWTIRDSNPGPVD